LAEVAFGYDLVFFIHADCAVGANHDAGPAAYAFVFVMFDFAGLGSLLMAPARHAVTQGASSQWRHCIANEIGFWTSRRTLATGLGRSLLYALIMSFVFECAVVQ
jgi:hypothetical protein